MMVGHIALYMSTKSPSIQDYKVFMHTLNKYEEQNLTTYVDGKTDNMVFEYKEAEESEPVKEQGTAMCASLKNLYFRELDILAIFKSKIDRFSRKRRSKRYM